MPRLFRRESPGTRIHQCAATRNGAADAIAQVIARIVSVGVDAPLADQREGSPLAHGKGSFKKGLLASTFSQWF
ncbi:hypothetical protein MESS2_870008 [Mesorhizobium metallidurans STM 2683]|uniref:Uncharacterized protein n=1 Tax=Mesorhizobium metallidurans STM 2683 TaxID=1297569 RepID=M5EYW7_9HYPH|nr:hypothetical protein MESS2_870008 [Mesorhizobium metallidurans STM 2683]